MPKLWETVTVMFFGALAMGNIDQLSNSVKNIGVYGTSTGSAVNLFFYLLIFAVMVLVLRSYLEK
ncbi:MAG: hypothetical protein ABEJ02_02995 [Candidatus Paceibacteria bacterium]